jgi:ABC-type multidrug transport system permease subunit
MNLTRLLAMTWARSLEFLRDISALGWNVFFPLLMVGGMAWIFSGPGRPQFKVAVIAAGPLTADTHPFLGTPHIQFYRETDREAALAKVARHRVDLLLDLGAETGFRAAGYWINEASPKGVLVEKILLASGGPPLARQLTGGKPIRYVDWLAPGILGMNMMFSCLFGIGYVIVRYRKSGYLKRLNATPLTALEFITAQLISRMVLILFITISVYFGTNAFLHFRMDGSYWTLLVVTVLGAVSMLAMGLMVSARISSEEFAGGLLNLFSWPMMVMSGVFFSLDGAPRLLQIVADLFPLTHLLEAARAVMLDGAGPAQISYHLLVLAGMSVLFLGLGAGMFRWRQD